MILKIYILPCCLYLILFSLKAQSYLNYTNIWYFGWGAGVDFSSGNPVALTNGAMNTPEGCASICDKNGNLLFYTNGNAVWNKNHDTLTNGFALLGGRSSTQSSIIVPHPGNTSIYYIFTIDDGDNGLKTTLRYSEVDMSMQNGLGEIRKKNILLLTKVDEKLTAVVHCNGHDIWVIAHKWNSNAFCAYLITAAGVDSIPVVSNVGISQYYQAGYMKVSSNGKKIAMIVTELKDQLFDFDNSKGIVSNPITLGNTNSFDYGVEFSPEATKLYIGSQTNNLIQYDLQSGDSISINASATYLNLDSRVLALQLARDNKIYCAQLYQDNQYLGVINNPNAKAADCNFQSHGVFLSWRNSSMGLPNFITSYFDTSHAACTDSLIGHKKNCNEIFIPNAFSPNGDGENDTLLVRANCLKDMEFIVYNRWGEKIFETKNIKVGWDGKPAAFIFGEGQKEKEEMNTGIYTYFLSGILDGKRIERKGTVSLIR